MKVFNVDSGGDFVPSDFILTDEDEVYVYSKGMGFFPHPTFTNQKELNAHLLQLLYEGATISNRPELINHYSQLIEKINKK